MALEITKKSIRNIACRFKKLQNKQKFANIKCLLKYRHCEVLKFVNIFYLIKFFQIKKKVFII